MSFAKSHLKAARDHISKKDFASAKKEAALVLDFEPDNYNAHVFLGLALLELNDLDESERIYLNATKLNPSQTLAWQGLSSFYERRQAWDKQSTILKHLLDLFCKSQDTVKCAETLQKLVSLFRQHGTQDQVIDALSYYLPDSEVYPLLSTLPRPDATNPTGTTTYDSQEAIHNGFKILYEIATTTDSIEEETFKREVERRRTRLGAPSPEQLRKEVFLEISNKSKLPSLWDALLNHPNTSDDLRAETEAKQLRYKQRQLYAIPLAEESFKRRISNELHELVEGIVLLQKSDELGWQLYFEAQDCEEISGYDLGRIRKFISLFPQSALSSLFKGYFAYIGSGLADDEEEDKDLFTVGDDDPLDIVIGAYATLDDTIIGNRILSEVYLNEVDYENAIKISKKGLRLLGKLESDTLKELSKTRTGFQTVLASSLVHFFSPKHHKEASAIVDEILQQSAQNISALMNRGYILEAASNWDGASAVFDKVSSILSPDFDSGLRAREESAWCKCQSGKIDQGLLELQEVLSIQDAMEGDEILSSRARCLWKIGKTYLDLDTPNIQVAYSHLIRSLKQDPEFAPAFTSLGLYYLDHASPPDPIRSSKCFQKAFELDARETLAARRLAEGFARDREWDLVEVVAQRTIDGEGGINAGLTKAELDPTSRYLPTNAWAWKALGIVKLHYKDYPEAIKSFQIALRVDPEDQPLWVRLGEAYHNAGRHVAALKALTHALELNPTDWVCSYTIAEVKHSMGLFEESVIFLENIRASLPDEPGVLALLARTHLDQGRSELSDGFQVRAEQSFVKAIDVSLDMIQRAPGLRTIAWKMVSDATFELGHFHVFSDANKLRRTLQAIPFLPPDDIPDDVTKIVPSPSFTHTGDLTATQVSAAAVYACLSQIALTGAAQSSHSSVWYDLSVALQAWSGKTPKPAANTTVQDKVVEYFKKALQLDPSKDTYWIALGNAYFVAHAKAAQHVYIKALELDSKNAFAWINLGLLYYYHGDIQLANEALYRAQVLDPDNAMAWIGQFLIASANEDKADAAVLLEHAVGLPTPVAEGDYEYASRVLNSTKNILRSNQVQESLLPAFFVLDRYCRSQPQEVSGLHLFALVCERIGHYERAVELVERAIGILETAYEETEDPEVEKKYTIANVTLGRLKLCQREYDESITFFESALGLLAEKEREDSDVKVLQVQSHFLLGLAHFYRGNLEEALGMLENGLEYAQDDVVLRGQIIIVLSQTLWAIGSDEAKETAKTRLLECIASDPENLIAINTLAGMGVVTNDEGLVDAALSEILSLPVDQKHKLDPQRHVDYLLIQHHLAQEDLNGALSIAQHAVSAEPSNIGSRTRLAALMVQRGENNTDTALALLAGMGDEGPNNKTGEVDAAVEALNIQAVAQTISAGTKDKAEEGALATERDALAKAQRAIMMRPSDPKNWDALAYVRARTV
ncbi:TPR-like protein [Agrocybe pediades]|nr:TPR-like protein [Agrocybe pediades]